MIKIEKLIKSEMVKKGWGYERILHNGDGYTFKLLSFFNNSQGSLHFHANKTETWYIQGGDIELTIIDPETGKHETHKLGDGDIVHIPRLHAHRVKALTDTLIFEASTPHEDSDTYRIAPGDSQK